VILSRSWDKRKDDVRIVSSRLAHHCVSNGSVQWSKSGLSSISPLMGHVGHRRPPSGYIKKEVFFSVHRYRYLPYGNYRRGSVW
jgi:hypothetical protein